MEENNLKDEWKFEERMDVPHIEKKKGDEYLTQNNMSEAMKCYSKAIMAIKVLFKDSTVSPDEIKKLAIEVGISCNLNLSYCYMKMKDWQKVVDNTNKVLELENEHPKALYRRCLAYIELNEFQKADEDLIVLEHLIGGTKELEVLESKLEMKQKESKQNEDVIFKKMFRRYVNGMYL